MQVARVVHLLGVHYNSSLISTIEYPSAESIAVENTNDAGEVACHKPEVQAKPIVPPSAAPWRPVNSGLGDLVLIVTCLSTAVW